MKNPLMFKAQSTHPIIGVHGETLAVEYQVYRSYPVIDATVYGVTLPSRVDAFQLKLVVSKVTGNDLVPCASLNFGVVTPLSGEMSYLVYGLSRRENLTIESITAIINEMKEGQERVFQEVALKELKKKTGFYKVKPSFRRTLLQEEARRLCHSL